MEMKNYIKARVEAEDVVFYQLAERKPDVWMYAGTKKQAGKTFSFIWGEEGMTEEWLDEMIFLLEIEKPHLKSTLLWMIGLKITSQHSHF